MTTNAERFYGYGMPDPIDFVGTLYEDLSSDELHVVKVRTGKNVADALESLHELNHQFDKLSYLDSLFDVDYGRKLDVAYALANATSKAILSKYGPETLAWTAANASISDLGERHRDGLEELLGVDKVLFEKARLWAWQRNASSKGREILEHYNFMDRLHSGALGTVDLNSVLRGAARPGVVLTDKRLGDYALAPLRARDSFSLPYGWEETWTANAVAPNAEYSIYLDAPTGFALLYKGVPQAAVALAPNPNASELMVYQLQGIKGTRMDPGKHRYSEERIIGTISARGLMPFDWQKLMVEVSSQLALDAGKTYIGIQGGENNQWYKTSLRGETGPHLPLEKAVAAYDMPAERLGFAKDKDGNWHKPIIA